MLRIDNLSVYYGRVRAVREACLRVEQGEIVTLVGANGAGKTSLLNAVAGLSPVSSGTVQFDGAAIAGLSAHTLARRGLGYVPEGRQTFGAMTVRDNLLLGAFGQARGAGSLLGPAGRFAGTEKVAASLERVYALFPVLRQRSAQRAGSLSGGEQQMLAIGRALMGSPRLLLLDEPSIGLAPQLVREIIALVGRLREAGLTVLLVEQDAVAALRVADRGYVMERGRIVMEGPAAELLASERVRHAYLGTTGVAKA
ncbi:MAG: ABC transporter ATP-binding protein [Chloroflexi bacterium]|nr:ABC transporter ATP-binding protein [Chloroflexota bacterium]